MLPLLFTGLLLLFIGMWLMYGL